MFNEAYAGSGLPLTGSTVAQSWDHLYGFLLWLSIFFFVLVVGAMVYFAVKHRAGAGAKSKYITGNHVLEIIWTLIPTLLLLVIFGWGYSVYNKMTQAPSDAMEIRVIGRQWSWAFQYDDGRMTTGELFVPVNKPVKLIMSSEDVLHDFFIPNFRVKQDVVPGMYTSVWFEATVPGKHQVFCAEYCGTSHSQMLAQLIALEPEQWAKWRRNEKAIDSKTIPRAGRTEVESYAEQTAVKTNSSGNLAEQGKALASSKGCIACHSEDGSAKIGPSYKGVFGSKVELADGSSVTADENYLRESIENPPAKVVKGFNPVMPPFKGILSEPEMNALVAYIKSLK